MEFTSRQKAAHRSEITAKPEDRKTCAFGNEIQRLACPVCIHLSKSILVLQHFLDMYHGNSMVFSILPCSRLSKRYNTMKFTTMNFTKSCPSHIIYIYFFNLFCGTRATFFFSGFFYLFEIDIFLGLSCHF